MAESQVTTNRLRYLLLSLEDRDLESQAIWGLRGVVDHAREGKVFKQVLKEILSGMDGAGGSARRNRYILAAYALERCPADMLQQVLQLVTRQILRRCGDERLENNIQAACDLAAQAVERSMIEQNLEMEKRGTSKSLEVYQKWLQCTLVMGVLKIVCRGPDKKQVVMGCLMLHGVLTVLMNWTHVPGVVDTVLNVIDRIVKSMVPGSSLMRSGEAFFVIQRCVEILGVHVPPAVVGGAINVCLMGAKEKDDFKVRRNSHNTLTTIAASVQVQDHSESGRLELRSCPLLGCVVKKKPQILKVLASAKYDKVVHVRKAALAAGVEMENIPDVLSQALKWSPPVHVSANSMVMKPSHPKETGLHKAHLSGQAVTDAPGSSGEVRAGMNKQMSSCGGSEQGEDAEKGRCSTTLKDEIIFESCHNHGEWAGRRASAGMEKSELQFTECSGIQDQGLMHVNAKVPCGTLDIGVQVFAPSGFSERGKAVGNEDDLSIRAPTSPLLGSSDYGGGMTPQSIGLHETLTTTKSCSIGESVHEDEETNGHERQAGIETIGEQELQTDGCPGNDLRIKYLPSSSIGKLDADGQAPANSRMKACENHCSTTSRTIQCRVGVGGTHYVPHQPTPAGMPGDLPAECEALLDKTICTLQKCMEDLPLILEEPSSGPGPGEVDRSVEAEESVPCHHSIKSPEQHVAPHADTARLSQISGIDYQEDNPLYSVSVDGASAISMPAVSGGTVSGPSTKQRSSHVLLEAHAEAMKKYYMERQELHIRLLDLQLERSIATMKAVVEHEKSLLQAASCQAVQYDLKYFRECLLGIEDKVD